MTAPEVPAPSGGTDLRGRVAAEVRAWMGRRRINVPKAAALMGTSPAYLYRRVNGETAFDVDDLDRLARALGVPLLAFFPSHLREEMNNERNSRRPTVSASPIGRAA